jgi:predicted nucleic acid-binding protein
MTVQLGASDRALLLDTNVLLLLLIGAWDPTRIAAFKNTDTFTDADFDLLKEILLRYGGVVTTPHVLAEASNLAGQHGEPERADIFQRFARLIPALDEQSTPAANAASDPAFVRLGLTDAAIALIAQAHACEVLTADVDLWAYLLTKGVTAHNFNHIRQHLVLP